jgi:hypothetical protein
MQHACRWDNDESRHVRIRMVFAEVLSDDARYRYAGADPEQWPPPKGRSGQIFRPSALL